MDNALRLGTPAYRWFRVVVIHEDLSLDMKIWDIAKTILVAIFTLGYSLLLYSPKHFCDVLVCRIEDASPVIRFQYDDVHDATLHAVSLSERLCSRSLAEFCRELDLGVDEAVDGRREFDMPVNSVVWVPVSEEARNSPAVLENLNLARPT